MGLHAFLLNKISLTLRSETSDALLLAPSAGPTLPTCGPPATTTLTFQFRKCHREALRFHQTTIDGTVAKDLARYCQLLSLMSMAVRLHTIVGAVSYFQH